MQQNCIDRDKMAIGNSMSICPYSFESLASVRELLSAAGTIGPNLKEWRCWIERMTSLIRNFGHPPAQIANSTVVARTIETSDTRLVRVRSDQPSVSTYILGCFTNSPDGVRHIQVISFKNNPSTTGPSVCCRGHASARTSVMRAI
ncbi:hypothetical protein IF2G_04658 [Cordyceps javanica]|nr:hypothetical protein IF2G_04658 [Cordyceps javanica]